MSWITIKLLGIRKVVGGDGVLAPQRDTVYFEDGIVTDDATNKRTKIVLSGTALQELTGLAPIVVEDNPDPQHRRVRISTATTVADGSMSADDKTKLDNLPAPADVATVDYVDDELAAVAAGLFLLKGTSVPAALPGGVAVGALGAQLVIANAGVNAIVPLRVNRAGPGGSVLDGLDFGRTLTTDIGTPGTGLRMRWFLPDGTGADTHVASVEAVATTVVGDSVSTRIIFSTRLGSTLGERLYLNPDGSLRALYYAEGRAFFDSDGNLTSSAITEAEVRAALAGATSEIDVNGQKIVDVASPTASGDAATKGYVDSVAQGLAPKTSVFVATTGPITLSGTQTIDGESVTAGKRVLVKDQGDAIENGFYLCAAGAWTRTDDLLAGASAAGVYAFVQSGSANHDTGWVCTSDDGADVVGTDALTFTQFTSAGEIVAGAGLTKTGLTIDVVAGDASVTVNANSIEASGAFGAKNVSTTGSIAGGSMTLSSGGTTYCSHSLVAGPTYRITNGAAATGGMQLATTVGAITVESATSLTLRANSGAVDCVSSTSTFNYYGSGVGLAKVEVLAPSGAHTTTHQSTTTSVSDTIAKRAGTGANAGAPRTISAQDGQDVAGGTNNNGGSVTIASGAAGMGGTGGAAGDVVVKAGSATQLTVAGDGSAATFVPRVAAKRFSSTPSTPSSSGGAVTFDLSASGHIDHDVTEATTVTVTGGTNGQEGTINVVQGTPGRTITMPTNGVGVEYSNDITALGGGSYQTAIIDPTALTRTMLRYRILPNGKAFIYGRSVGVIP